MTNRIWQPLSERHIDELITLAVQAYELARRTPSMQRLAAYMIKLAVWRYTADAVDAKTGIVVPDAVKYDIRFLPHSVAASAVSRDYPKEMSRHLTHEHSFPLSLIAEMIFGLKEGSSREEIREIFTKYCRAAIVTREEDRLLSGLKLRSKMPAGWITGDEIFARYAAVGIEILPPAG